MSYYFDIKEYFNSLPDDIEEIDVGGKGLTYLPDLSRFTNLKELFCSHNQLVTLPPLPNSLRRLYCSNNQLISLPTFPNSLQKLICSINQLSSLPPLPNSLRELYCSSNQLVSLPPLPNSLQELICSNNQLVSLPLLPNSLQRLHCGNNQLVSLPPLPNSLQRLHCGNNQLVSLPFPNSLIYLYYCKNPIYNIINSDNVDVAKKNIKILNKFRDLYYCIKYKKYFVKWLWKSREKKIQEEFHPNRLREMLEGKDIDDIDF